MTYQCDIDIFVFFYRPSIADDQKIGFFRLDRSTQTEVSQIVEIKELSDNVHQLLEVCWRVSVK